MSVWSEEGSTMEDRLRVTGADSGDEEENETSNEDLNMTDEELLYIAENFFDIFLQERFDPQEVAEEPVIQSYTEAPVGVSTSSGVSEVNTEEICKNTEGGSTTENWISPTFDIFPLPDSADSSSPSLTEASLLFVAPDIMEPNVGIVHGIK